MSKKITVDIIKEGALLPIGCKIEGGEVLPTCSPKRMGDIVAGKLVAAFHSNHADKFFLVVDDKLYVSTSGTMFSQLGALSGNSPYMIEDRIDGVFKCAVISNDTAFTYDGTSYSSLQPFKSLSAAISYHGRIFGVDKDDGYMLRWSGSDITDGEERLYGAGSLKLDTSKGKILNLVEYDSSLALVREYGLTFFKADKSPEYFTVQTSNENCAKILQNTAQCVNGKIIFCTENGIYAYDGKSAERVKHRFSQDISNFSNAVCYDGVYYAACTVNDRKDILCYDVKSGESYLADVGADCMCIHGGVWVFNTNGVFKLVKSENYSLTSESNFNLNCKKTLSALNVCGKCEVTITGGGHSKTFANVQGKVKVGLKGDNFVFSVIGEGVIKSITAVAEVCDVI